MSEKFDAKAATQDEFEAERDKWLNKAVGYDTEISDGNPEEQKTKGRFRDMAFRKAEQIEEARFAA